MEEVNNIKVFIEYVSSVVTVGLIILAVYWIFSLISIHYSSKIFNCINEEIYEKQWKPVVGLFYSYYLRKMYGQRKGCMFDYKKQRWVQFEPFFAVYDLDGNMIFCE